MDLKNFFFLIGSIALSLISITIIAIFILLYRIKKHFKDAAVKITESVRVFERYSAAKFFVRILKLIF